jgi:hypothetical protein
MWLGELSRLHFLGTQKQVGARWADNRGFGEDLKKFTKYCNIIKGCVKLQKSAVRNFLF